MENETPDLGEFAATIRAIDASESDPERHLSIQIDAAVRDAVLAAQKSGEKASVTVQVIAEPQNDRRVRMAVKLKTSLPRPPASAVVLYADDCGALHGSNPRQEPLPFPAPPTLVKKPS